MLSSKDLNSMTLPAFTKAQQEALALAYQQTINIQKEIDALQKELVELRSKTIEGIVI